ncbi:MAG: DUF1573 domain-containing protein [Planctomycetes bacterium]|nr:DUF1573 domain-containing protein [Planctomycetota bacterium]
MSKKKIHIAIVGVISVCLLAIGAWFIVTVVFSGPLTGNMRHDFGVVQIDRPKTVLTHTYRLQNTTDHALQLTNAVPSCGCTTTDWPKEPVGVGEELVVPVNLTLRRSQLRTSSVRLEFATGEVVVLRIQGIGRFTQPMSIMPPEPILYSNAMQGTRAILSLEWSGKEKPEKPTLKVPEGLHIEFDDWILSKEAEANIGIPELWTIRMRLMLREDVEGSQEFSINMLESPELVVHFRVDTEPPGAIRD